MNIPIPITPRLILPAHDLHYEFSRSGGPGGQHVNTTSTRVRLRFSLASCEVLSPEIKDRIMAARPNDVNDAGELLIVCDEHRSRQMNIETVRARLIALIRSCLYPPKKRIPTRPTRSSQLQRVDAKTRRGTVKAGRGKISSDD